VSDADRNRLVACRACGNRVPRDARRCPACGTREPTAPADASAPAASEGAARPPDVPADVVSPPVAPTTERHDIPPEIVPPPAAPSTKRPDVSPAAEVEPGPPAPREGPMLTAPRAPRGGARPPRVSPRQAARRRRRGLVTTLAVLFALTAAAVTALYVTLPSGPSSMPGRPEPAPTPAVAPPAPAVTTPNTPSRSRGRSEWLFFFKPGDWLTRMADEGLLGVVVRVEKTHTFADGSTGPAYVVQSIDGEERVLDADELERTARLR